ncbi:MCE family protein [Streptomyces sp. B1866]|uniref:MCE family protein n=1 Tax=Streptomyces sp. B1866 TaxID=3075431 RepID=UPI00288EA6C9|nr:MCE family protein [Streptomyces sp. B1866]MDT3397039.1 MCE family protein [Streptomyces sp. B1866]
MTPKRLLVMVVALAVLLGGGTAVGMSVLGGPDGNRFTAYFDRTVGLYKGSDIRVLGVAVGRIDSVKPEGKQVKVTATLNEGVKIPAQASAVVVAPTIVSGRYLQLAPAYTTGATLRDGAVIPADRTATPMEVDELYTSLVRLADDLGPRGANKNGALSEVLDTGAKNLKGNGKAFGDTIRQLGSLSKTLSGTDKDLFGTITNLSKFAGMLKDNDTKVRQAQEQLGKVSTFLADDRDDLAAALRQLGTALGKVQSFIKDNRNVFKASVDKLIPITQSLVDQRASFGEALDVAPLAVANVLNAYNPSTRTLDGRANMNELSMGNVPRSADAYQGDSLLPLPATGTFYGSDAGKGKDR